jgi:hypothetical protein
MGPLYELAIGVKALSCQDIILDVCVEIFVGVFELLKLLPSFCFVVGQIFQKLLVACLEIGLVLCQGKDAG